MASSTMNGKYMKIDLLSPIVPGESAAGVKLGWHRDDFFQLFSKATQWDRKCQIQEAIEECASWLHVPPKKPVASGRIEDSYYYSKGAVRLCFDTDGFLVVIILAHGYAGKIFNKIGIGDKLMHVLTHADLVYDDNDELHHAFIDKHEIGLSFYADENPIFVSPEQNISRIFIHKDFL